MEYITQSKEPDFIKYLLDPVVEHDCYFLVGNEAQSIPVKIGAVKKMLMSHSIVLRNELQDSKLAEKSIQPISITDLCPDTFKNLLKYVYGFDNIFNLSFHDADNLLYAAEKYIMMPLKNKLALRLISMLSPENICSLMNNPAVFHHLTLNNAISKILQYETDKVLYSTQFLELSTIALSKILEQEAMTVPEIEVWRAALSWAKNKAGTDNGLILREHLDEHLKHIRLCTLTSEELCTEVVSAGVLRPSEFMMVCEAVGSKKRQENLQGVSNKLETRSDASILRRNVLQVDFDLKHVDFDLKHVIPSTAKIRFVTKNHTVQLLGLVAKLYPTTNLNLPIHVKVSITCTQPENGNKKKITFGQFVQTDGETNINLWKDAMNSVQLPPHTRHAITIEPQNCYLSLNCCGNMKTFHHDHFKVHFMKHYENGYFSPISKINYKIVS